MRRSSRTGQTGWSVNGESITLREGYKTFGLQPEGWTPPRQDRLRKWWRNQRRELARRIAP